MAGKRSRAEKLARLVAVQKQLERMAEIELADSQRRRADVADAIEGIVDAMHEMTPVHRGFSDLYAMRISRLTAQDRQLEGLVAVQTRKVRVEHAKAERLEENRRDAATVEARGEEEASLFDLIDQLGTVTPQASGKLRRP